MVHFVGVGLIAGRIRRETFLRYDQLLRQNPLTDLNLRAHRHHREQLLHILPAHPDTPQRLILADAIRLIRPMNCIITVRELHTAAAEFPVIAPVRVHDLILNEELSFRCLISAESHRIIPYNHISAGDRQTVVLLINNDSKRLFEKSFSPAPPPDVRLSALAPEYPPLGLLTAVEMQRAAAPLPVRHCAAVRRLPSSAG